MPFTTQATSTTYLTPADKDAALGALLSLIAGATTSIRILMYGFTHLQIIDALAAAHTRGVDVKLILDHTQSTGPTEALGLHRLLMTVPADNVRIGTSPTKHQIMHLKGIVVDSLHVGDGSLNYSPSGLDQVNDLNVVESDVRASNFQALFDSLWTWISQSEPTYQLPGKTAPMAPNVQSVGP